MRSAAGVLAGYCGSTLASLKTSCMYRPAGLDGRFGSFSPSSPPRLAFCTAHASHENERPPLMHRALARAGPLLANTVSGVCLRHHDESARCGLHLGLSERALLRLERLLQPSAPLRPIGLLRRLSTGASRVRMAIFFDAAAQADGATGMDAAQGTHFREDSTT